MRFLLTLSLLPLLAGCLGPEVTIANMLVTASVKTAMEYNEKMQPTPDEAWQIHHLRNLKTRATAGDVDAQYQLAMWYQRAGNKAAYAWMCEAANRGRPDAQLQLGHWYNETRKTDDQWPFILVTPDDTKAYVWYSLAASNGEIMAAYYRDRLVVDSLSERQLAAAERQVADWQPGGCGYFASRGAAIDPGAPSRQRR